MLNDVTKKKINSLRQILVGKVPDPKSQVDQITNALIYKYMDDMDRQAEAFGGKAAFFVGEYEKYSWRKLMDPRLGGQDRLNLYVEALDKMSQNKNLSPIFRQILRGAFLPYRSPETLNLFLSEVDGFAYEHSEELGNAYEYLLSIMGSQGDAGQFRTPRHIIDFIVDVIDPKKGDRILDPACGTAGFLISAYKHIIGNHDGMDNVTGKKSSKEERLTPEEMKSLHRNFTGYDIDPGMTKLARVNMFLHNFPEPKIQEYDTLSDDSHWEDRYEIILANPPFMSPKGGIIPHKRFSISATRAEVLFVDYIVEHLTTKGRAGIIVPEGIIFQSGTAYKQLRKQLVEDGLFAVVSLPSGVFNPYAGVKTSILLFDAEVGKRQADIVFVKVGNDGYDLGAQRREIAKNDLPEAAEILKAWRKGERKESPLATWVPREKIAETGDYNLSGDRYRIATDYSNAKWPIVEIGEMADLIRGVVYSKSDEVPDDGHQILRAMNITLEGGLLLEDVKRITKNKKLKETQALKKGDIFICLASGSKEHIGKVTYIERDTEYYFGGFMGAIRTKDLSVLSSKYLYSVLRSERFKHYLKSAICGANINNLNSGILGKFKVPLPPTEVQERIVAELDGYQNIISGARQVVDNWKPKIDIDPAWENRAVSEIAKLEYGIGESAKETGEYRYVRITDIGENGELKNTEKKFIGETEESKKYALRRGDVLVARTGATFGKTVYFDQDEKAAFAGFLIRLNFDRKKINSKFYWCFAQSENYWEQAKTLMTGGAQPQFNANAVGNVIVPLPPLEIQKQIVEKIESERALVESNKKLIELYEQKMKDAIGKLWNE